MAATSFVPTQPVGTYHGEGKHGRVHAHAHVHLRVRSSMRRQMCMHVHVHMQIHMRLRLHTCVWQRSLLAASLSLAASGA